jgi:hypothetical protein
MPLVKMAIDAKITLVANREFPEIILMPAAMWSRIARLKWDFCNRLSFFMVVRRRKGSLFIYGAESMASPDR